MPGPHQTAPLDTFNDHQESSDRANFSLSETRLAQTPSSSGEKSGNNALGQSSLWDKVFGVNGLVGFVAVLITLFTFLAATHVWPFSDKSVSSGTKSTPSSGTTSTPHTRPSAHSVVPLSFYEPHDMAQEGLVVGVTLRGTIPPSEHLWVFVCHLGYCYPQGAPTQVTANIWSLSTVNLGSNLASDENSWYTVYAVLANSQANRVILAEFKSTDYGNSGMRKIPGGSGAKEVAHIILYRNH
jgi:hypothetical protein